MDLQIAGHVAVIVGGARGIGLAIARAFAAEGARVALIDRQIDTADVARGLAGAIQAHGVVADVTDYDGVVAAADQIHAQLGPIHHVVFCVGIGSGKYGFPFWNVDPADWPRVLQVNLVGAVHTAHVFAPHLIASGNGTLLFLSSVAGQIGSQTDPPYSASKAGLINFAQCVAKDMAPHGVRVNTICPGMIETELARSIHAGWQQLDPAKNVLTYEEWTRDKIQRLVPLGRGQTPDDIAAMAVFLASPRAGNVTGQTINVDGGFVMHW